MLNQLLGDPLQRVAACLSALRQGMGVLVLDDVDRENEGDLIFSAEKITVEQMALTIRHGSGIVCLCITEEKRQQLQLPFMVQHNTSRNHTPFTISIEAAQGVTTGVSAQDRVTTIKTAIAATAQPSDLNHPGHIFPLCAAENGVLQRKGHTEATIDLMRLAGLQPYGVLCELMLDNGEMARTPEVVAFARQHTMPVVTVDDIVQYRLTYSL